jgi:hypothetical protein
MRFLAEYIALKESYLLINILNTNFKEWKWLGSVWGTDRESRLPRDVSLGQVVPFAAPDWTYRKFLAEIAVNWIE